MTAALRSLAALLLGYLSMVLLQVLFQEVMFGQPDVVETELLRTHDLVETRVIKLSIVALPLRRIAKVIPQPKA